MRVVIVPVLRGAIWTGEDGAFGTSGDFLGALFFSHEGTKTRRHEGTKNRKEWGDCEMGYRLVMGGVWKRGLAMNGCAMRMISAMALVVLAGCGQAPVREKQFVVGSPEEVAAEIQKSGGETPAYMRPMQPDAALAAVIGEAAVPRVEVTRKLWVYIKVHKLQDSEKKTIIHADEKLKAVFNGRDSVTMFEMTKLVEEHLTTN